MDLIDGGKENVKTFKPKKTFQTNDYNQKRTYEEGFIDGYNHALRLLNINLKNLKDQIEKDGDITA